MNRLRSLSKAGVVVLGGEQITGLSFADEKTLIRSHFEVLNHSQRQIAGQVIVSEGEM